MMNKFFLKVYDSLVRRLEKDRSTDGGVFFPKLPIVVNTTTRCNFRCPHCLRENLDKDKALIRDLSPEILEAAIREAVKVNYGFVSFSGGEPILNPHFPEMIEIVKKYGCRYNFVTNGWFYEKYWPLIENSRSNFGEIIISIDGPTAEIHDKVRNKSGSFAKILEAVKFFRQRQIPIIATYCITRLNRHYLEEFCNFCREHDIETIKWCAVLSFKKNCDDYGLSDEDKTEVLREIRQLMSKFRNTPNMLTTAYLVSRGAVSEAGDMAVFCPVLQNTCPGFLDHDGALLFCCDLYEDFIKKPLIHKLGFKKCLEINFDTISEIKKQHAGILLGKKAPESVNICALCNKSARDYLSGLSEL